MTVLIDINVALDVLLEREAFVDDSGAVWRACDAGRFGGYLCATTLTTIFYVVRKSAGLDRAFAAVDSCLAC